MALYYVGQLLVYGGDRDPRISARVWRVSDFTKLGRLQVWSGLQAIERPTATPPREWLVEALGQWREW